MLSKAVKKTNGFTLVEVMIVVAIVGVLASMAVPNFMRSRQSAQEAACIANLRTIYGAVVAANMDEKLSTRHWCDPGFDYHLWASPDDAGLVTRYLNQTPVCPFGRGSRYHAYPVGDTLYVVCNFYDENYHNVRADGITTHTFRED